jgi:sugar phosphate permease
MSQTALEGGIALGGSQKATLSALQKRALTKTAWRLVPILTIAYLFNYLDRTAVGFAALEMNQDLGLTNTQFGLAAGFFFISMREKSSVAALSSARGTEKFTSFIAAACLPLKVSPVQA